MNDPQTTSAPRSPSEWRTLAQQAERITTPFIDGEYTSAGDQIFEVVAPASGEVIAAVSAADAETIDRAVRAARRSFERGVWSRRPPKERKKVLLRLAEQLAACRDELAALLSLEVGKPIAASLAEIDAAAESFAFYGEALDKIYGEIAPTGEASLTLVSREPMGVVGMVTPWNYPLLMAARKAAPALAAGNSAILKPAEQAPLATLRIGKLAASAGLPDGVLNVVPGLGEIAGRALGCHRDVDAISFTGSTAVGKLFLRYASESNMKAVTLECGGKSPNIICADVPDPGLAARAAAEAIYSNAGQMCNAGSRLLIDARVHDDFLAAVVESASRWLPGDPFDMRTPMGPLVDEVQFDRVLGYVERGVEEGARLTYGGRRALPDSGGFFVEPTVFSEVTNSMTIARDEIFGPVLTALRFHSLEEAVAIANDSSYGLAAGLWTSDLTTAHRLARALRAGSVYVNCYDRGDLSVPFGGYKESGVGVDKSLLAVEKYCRVKSTWINLA
jgi:4-guanidinobutyraldehyde dehydrogenase / NAD-dependent aldehyde dehydrogenase